MNEREEIMILMAEVLGLCYEISVNSEADCFFNYSPHVNGLCVQVFEVGWGQALNSENNTTPRPRLPFSVRCGSSSH